MTGSEGTEQQDERRKLLIEHSIEIDAREKENKEGREQGGIKSTKGRRFVEGRGRGKGDQPGVVD